MLTSFQEQLRCVLEGSKGRILAAETQGVDFTFSKVKKGRTLPGTSLELFHLEAGSVEMVGQDCIPEFQNLFLGLRRI